MLGETMELVLGADPCVNTSCLGTFPIDTRDKITGVALEDSLPQEINVTSSYCHLAQLRKL